MDGGAWQATVSGVAESDTTERLSLSLSKPQEGFLKKGGGGVKKIKPYPVEFRDLEIKRPSKL